MNQLNIFLKNCFGIGSLIHEFNFNNDQTNTYLIYAPNGTMKSSLAKTFSSLSTNKSPTDQIYSQRTTSYNVSVDGNPIKSESILVINAEDTSLDSTNKITSFIARKELKERYDEIFLEFQNSKDSLIKSLKGISKSSDCESELINTFSENYKNNIFDIFINLEPRLDEELEEYTFRYNDIFDKGGKVKNFLLSNHALLQVYLDNYQNLLNQSSFFNQSNYSFGTYQANQLVSSIEDESFFQAGHTITLKDNTTINSSSQLKLLVQEEINKILNDETLKKSFDKIDKELSKNNELRAFKDAIEKHNFLLIKLMNYEEFKKEVWLSYLIQMKQQTNECCKLYNEKIIEIEDILEQAKSESDTWKQVIETFNTRFYVPFRIELKNQEDIILKETTPNLTFHYSDNDQETKEQDKNNLLKVLSKGEHRAFFILQMLFEIEARKSQGIETLLILDDIADSFDYKNKYAIIQYIKDLNQTTNFKILVLTHNFDFYRTLSSRLGLKRKHIFMTTKSLANREIKLTEGQYLKNIFNNYLNNLNEKTIFLTAIPFLRNIIEYIEGDSSINYLLLTSCLHIKHDSSNITFSEISNIFNSILPQNQNLVVDFNSEKIIAETFNMANEICSNSEIDEIKLENKIVLSIAIRLKAEEFMLSKLSANALNGINSNQTSKLFEKYRESNPDLISLRVLDRVNLMTPENIHVNSFMYEPLLDMSVYHLVDLYKEVKAL